MSNNQRKIRLYSWKRVAVIAITWFGVSLFFYWLGAADFLETKIEHPMLFQIREKMGKSPQVSDNLSIFLFDDKTFATLKRNHLTFKEWYLLINQIATAKAKVVIIPDGFSIVPDEDNLEYYLRKITNLKFPVVAAVWTHFLHLPNMPTFLDSGGNVSYFAWDNTKISTSLKPDRSKFPFLLQKNDEYIYGPNRKLLEETVFTNLGHTNLEQPQTFSPVVYLKTKVEIPHISLFAANKREVKLGQLFLEDKEVFVDEKGYAYLNYIPSAYFYKKSHSLVNLLNQAENKTNHTKPLIKEGDVVLILTNLFTGAVKFIQTPFELAPSLFTIATAINGTLTGRWIRPLEGTGYLMVMAAVAGVLLNLSGSLPVFWLFFGLISLGTIGLEIMLFAFFDIYMRSFLPVFTFAGMGVIIFADKARFREKRLWELRLVEAEKERMEFELKEAAIIAKAMLPDSTPSWPFCAIDVFHKPMSESSGDWYAFESSRSKRLFHFIMCDITGHGAQAAIIVSTCRTVLSMIVRNSPEVLDNKEFLCLYAKELNATLFHQGSGYHTSTIVGLSFVPEEEKVFFLAAGHPVPIFIDINLGEEQPKKTFSRHNPLGVSQEIFVNLSESKFGKSNQVIVYSDGAPLGNAGSTLIKEFGSSWYSDIATSRELFEKMWGSTPRRRASDLDDVSIVWFKRI